MAGKHCGALVDGGQAVGTAALLPLVLGLGEECAGGIDGGGVLHVGDVDPLGDVFVTLPARPDEVILTVIAKDCTVDGPLVGVVGDLADHLVLAGSVVGLGAETVHSVIVVVAVVGGNVNIPPSCNLMQFGRPIFLGVHSFFGGAVADGVLFPLNSDESFAAGNGNAVSDAVAVEIAVAVADYPRIVGTLGEGIFIGLHRDLLSCRVCNDLEYSITHFDRFCKRDFCKHLRGIDFDHSANRRLGGKFDQAIRESPLRRYMRTVFENL